MGVAAGDGDALGGRLAGLEQVAQAAQRLAPAALLPDRGAARAARAPDRPDSRARSSERRGPWSATPGPSRSSQSGGRRDPVGAAAAAVLDDPVRLRRARRSSCPSRPPAARPELRNRAPAPTPVDSIRVRWKSARKWSVKEGRRARSAIASKTRSRGTSISISALTGPIGGAILVAQRWPANCVQSAAKRLRMRCSCTARTIIAEAPEGGSHLYQCQPQRVDR